ncbi:MAG TPA: GNAT family N-acetyltransferase [Acidimicrobiia bacterium]|nr:GNAT family N-acetyltransferase [Acidimicrobiia bacterium]
MLVTESISTTRLTLTPLEVADAAEMVGVLSEPALYTFTGGMPPTQAQLEELYRRQSAGSPWGGEFWHNWILRLDGRAIGFVQATVRSDSADLAWVVGVPWQGSGYASEASEAIRDWLRDRGAVRFSAHIHPDHSASHAIAARLGLQPTGQLDDDGEMIWK